MSKFISNPSTDYTRAIEALSKLPDHDIVRVYADTVHLSLLESFTTRYKIKRRRPLGYHVCVHRLKGNRQCPGYARYAPHGLRCPQIPDGDHLSEWVSKNKTVAILSQPYGLTFKSVVETVKFCKEHGLQVEIDSYPSFHFPGVVLSLVFTRKGFCLSSDNPE